MFVGWILLKTMAQLIRLKRSNTGTPWGFRLNGGTDMGQPLHILKVSILPSAFSIVPVRKAVGSFRTSACLISDV